MDLWACVKQQVRLSPRLVTIIQALRALPYKAPMWVPPGHYYSPIPNLDELESQAASIWGLARPALPGVDLNEGEQLALIGALAPHYVDMPAYASGSDTALRYHWPNDFFPYADAMILYGLLRHLRPSRIVEIGAGFSSCVMLDTNERYFSNSILCTFVEPHPHRFASLLKSSDQSRIEVIQRRVQDVEPGLFSALGSNDILFVDSSHVMKTASDVNYLLFEILPHLASGVYVHFHDIAYPFEYPSSWATEGRAWNEAYALRAFLQYNSAFRVVCFVSYLLQFHDAVLKQLIPVGENSGCSIWLKRI